MMNQSSSSKRQKTLPNEEVLTCLVSSLYSKVLDYEVYTDMMNRRQRNTSSFTQIMKDIYREIEQMVESNPFLLSTPVLFSGTITTVCDTTNQQKSPINE